jgi:purine-binding chemotaxis protein CheW
MADHLLVRARSMVAAFPVAATLETMRPRTIEPVAGVPAFVLGVSLIRGAPLPVIDLGALFGSAEPRATRRFVTVASGGRVTALAVEAVLAVRALADADASALPPLLAGTQDGAVALLGTLDRELLAVIEAARLLEPALHERIVGDR